MGHRSELATPDNSEDESGDAFTDGDFGDSEDETHVERNDDSKSHLPVNETVNKDVHTSNGELGDLELLSPEKSATSRQRDSETQSSGLETQSQAVLDIKRDSLCEQTPSIVGILGDQQNHVCTRIRVFSEIPVIFYSVTQGADLIKFYIFQY